MNPKPRRRLPKTELARITAPALATIPALGPADVLAAFLAGRNARTLIAYDRDLADFAWHVREPNAKAGLAMLLGLPHGQANATVLAYKASMVDRKLKSATIARRLAALRSVVKMARTIGVVVWSLDVENPKAEPPRDMSGPGADGWRDILALARHNVEHGKKHRHAKAVRDLAIIRTLHDLALRRGELVVLDRADLDMDAKKVAVIGKGHTEPVSLTIPDPTLAALAAWLDVRGREPGPLFTRLDKAAEAAEAAGRPDRLTDNGVYRIVVDLGEKAGRGRVRPHGLRHEAITRALNKNKGDVRKVRRFSRHASVQTVLIYDDQQQDVAGEIAKTVAEDDAELVAEDVMAENVMAENVMAKVVDRLMAAGWTPPARTPTNPGDPAPGAC